MPFQNEKYENIEKFLFLRDTLRNKTFVTENHRENVEEKMFEMFNQTQSMTRK